MRLADFRDLIAAMPVDAHAFWAYRETWQAHINGGGTAGAALAAVFDADSDPTGVKVSRGDIRAYARAGLLPESLMAALVWGYPRGMRGGYTASVCAGLDVTVRLLKPLVPGDIDDWQLHYSEAHVVPGLGLSTYSKFLAFLPVSVQGHQALILDSVVAMVAADGRFDEMKALTGLKYENAVARYPEYLAHMASTAHELGVTAEQVEMFLFAFGRNLKLDA